MMGKWRVLGLHSDQFVIDSGGGGVDFQLKTKINTTPPSILMIREWRVGLAANSSLILGEGWFLFLISFWARL